VPAPEAAAARAAAAVPPPAAKPWLTVGAAAAAPPAELQASAKALPFKPTRGRPRNTPYECQICGADLTTAKYYHKVSATGGCRVRFAAAPSAAFRGSSNPPSRLPRQPA
jgi:hypothetical protein